MSKIMDEDYSDSDGDVVMMMEFEHDMTQTYPDHLWDWPIYLHWGGFWSGVNGAAYIPVPWNGMCRSSYSVRLGSRLLELPGSSRESASQSTPSPVDPERGPPSSLPDAPGPSYASDPNLLEGSGPSKLYDSMVLRDPRAVNGAFGLFISGQPRSPGLEP